MRQHETSVTIGSAATSLLVTYPNSVIFMYSRQPLIIDVLSGGGSEEFRVTVECGGRSHSELRKAYGTRANFELSRIFQLLASDIDELPQRLGHDAGQSLSEEFTVTVEILKSSNTYTPVLTSSITAMHGALDQGELYGEHTQRRLWVNFPQTFNLWKDSSGETAFILDDAYIYPDIEDDNSPCHECDFIGTLLAAGELDEFKRLLPARPVRNIGLTWRTRIEQGAELSSDIRIVTLIPDYSTRDAGTYLRWLNRRGEMSYYLFKDSQQRVVTTVDGSFSRFYANDLNTPVNKTLNNSFKSQYREVRELVIGATGVTQDEFEDLCDLASSPIVERLLPRVADEDTNVVTVYDGGNALNDSQVSIDSESSDGTTVDAGGAAPDRLANDEYVWQRVNVSAGTYARNIRRKTPNGQDFEIVIELPERNTIKL